MIGSTLYVVRNADNLIDVYRIRGGAVTLEGTITQADVPGQLDFPTTVAFAGGSLWAANARFTTPPTPETPYWVTRVLIR